MNLSVCRHIGLSAYCLQIMAEQENRYNRLMHAAAAVEEKIDIVAEKHFQGS